MTTTPQTIRKAAHKLTAHGCSCGQYCRRQERWKGDQLTGLKGQAETVQKMTRQGYSTPQIARRLNISQRTVQRHRKRLGISQQSPREKRRQLLASGHQCTPQCAINHRHHQGKKVA